MTNRSEKSVALMYRTILREIATEHLAFTGEGSLAPSLVPSKEVTAKGFRRE
jgi:hypothetical protein